MKTPPPSPRAGFSLIELLAVIFILGILSAVLLTTLGSSEETVRVQATAQKLTMPSAALEQYYNDKGDYPPSTFSPKQQVANDGENVGIEALVVALWSNGYEAGGVLNDEADRLVNTDGDSAPAGLTDFPTRELLEVADDWGNPLAYVHKNDYDLPNRPYVTLDLKTGAELRSTPPVYKNPTTGRYYNHTSFQLSSAGPDALFGTDDDITTFDRN